MIGKLNKRAISPLIATVIIIAITVAAGIVLYAMIWPLINRPISQTTCTEITFELDAEASCMKVLSSDPINQVNQVDVSIDRTKSNDDEPNVVVWKLVLDAGFGERRSIDILSSTFSVSPGQQSTYSYNVSAAMKTDLGGDVNRISIYPVIESRNTQVACEELTRTIERLRDCV